MSLQEDEIPTEVWDQDVPNGGASDGELPGAALATVPVGIGTVREVPPLKATFGLLPLGAAGSAQRIGREPRRRRLLVSVRPSATVTAYVVIGETQQQATSGYGLPVTQGAAPIEFFYAGELWFAAFGAADLAVGFIAELDQG